jgi:prephenate dehydrogenase
MPVAVLKSGMTVGNFSSPHPFTFEDETVLQGCDAERCKALSLREEEVEAPFLGDARKYGVTAVTPKFGITDEVRSALVQASYEADLVLISFPTLSALKEAGELENFLSVCTIRADRLTKKVSTTKFCR